MAKFIFKYKTILRYRKLRAALKGAEVAKINREIHHVVKDINMLKETQHSITGNIATIAKSPLLPLETIKLGWEQWFFLQAAIGTYNYKLNTLHKKSAEKTKELIYWMKQKKIMEKLKEKHFENFKEANNREERKLIDDIVTSNHARTKFL